MHPYRVKCCIDDYNDPSEDEEEKQRCDSEDVYRRMVDDETVLYVSVPLNAVEFDEESTTVHLEEIISRLQRIQFCLKYEVPISLTHSKGFV